MHQLTDHDVDQLWTLLSDCLRVCGPREAFRNRLSLLVATDTVKLQINAEQMEVTLPPDVWILRRHRLTDASPAGGGGDRPCLQSEY